MTRKRILVVCPYPEGEVPGQRLKYEQYFSAFRNNGYEIVVSSFLDLPTYRILYKPGNYLAKVIGVLKGYIKRFYEIFTLKNYDGVYVFLYVTPFGGPFFEKIFRKQSRKMIYDIDDLVFHGQTTKNNSVVKPLRKESKYYYLFSAADHVITCTPYLDSFVRKFNQNTTDISSTINTDTYQPINDYTNDSELILGWSGSHSTSAYMKLLEPVLTELKKKYKFKILVIGNPNFRFTNLDVEAIAWNEKSEVADLSRIDIGLYPLPNEQWVMGKSGLKALQYMALGIPTVATKIGANSRVIEDGISGFLVESNQQWIDRLSQLIENHQLRRTIGTKARQRVVELYSIKANTPVYLKIFNQIFGTPNNGESKATGANHAA